MIKPKKVFDTLMYRASRVLRSLQYTSGFNVIRDWNEALLDAAEKDPAEKEVMAAIATNFLLSWAKENQG